MEQLSSLFLVCLTLFPPGTFNPGLHGDGMEAFLLALKGESGAIAETKISSVRPYEVDGVDAVLVPSPRLPGTRAKIC